MKNGKVNFQKMEKFEQDEKLFLLDTNPDTKFFDF